MASKCFCKSCEGDQRGLAGPCTAKPFVSTAGMFVRPLPGAKFVPVPSTAGNIVAMTLFRDRLYVAFQYGVYRREDDDTWTQILIVKNEAECVRCGHILQSLHVHDYRTHSCCKSIWFMVDGGDAYIRRGWGGPGLSGDPADHYIERSIERVPVGFGVWLERNA